MDVFLKLVKCCVCTRSDWAKTAMCNLKSIALIPLMKTLQDN